MSSSRVTRRRPGVSRAGDAGVANDNASPQVSSQQSHQSSVNRRVLSRVALSAIILAMVYYTTKTKQEELLMASASEDIMGSPKGQEVVCSDDYNQDRVQFKHCAPQSCGRFVSDAIVSPTEAKHLLSLAKRGLSLGGSSGGASILDLHSGALSMDTNFVNIYKLIESKVNENIFTQNDFDVYKNVKNKIKETIAVHFGIPSKHLYLTHPTFFSRITSDSAKTVHDEYWHKHIDKQTYKSFHYTSLLYLSTFGHDFSGGRFIFVDKAMNKSIAIEPKIGRLSAFTSGSENEHFVEKVSQGIRYAITVSFTCDPKFAINDPTLIKQKK